MGEVAKPKELVIRGTDTVGAYMCARCNRVGVTRESVAHCCRPRVCGCGAECLPYWTICNKCRTRKEQERESAQLKGVKKIPWRDYDGPVFDGGDYYGTVEELADRYACDADPGDWPKHVWACTSKRLSLDAEDILEIALDDHHEDARDQIGDTVELQIFLDRWCADQCVESWEPDYSRAVLLDGLEAEYGEDS